MVVLGSLQKLDEKRGTPEDDYGYKTYCDLRDHRRTGQAEEFLNDHETRVSVFESAAHI